MGVERLLIVVDTHIVIWAALQPGRLTQTAKSMMKRANNSDGIIVSTISLWEIAMLIQKKRLEIGISYLEFINLIKAANKYRYQNITPEIADLSARLFGEINADPADGIIAATSAVCNVPLLTADKKMRESSLITTIWE